MIVPTYYQDFQCLAGACRHNCCIGWEIDIDAGTMARYRAIPGEAGERLRGRIAGDPPHFVLDGEGRCPCLTGENLCALLLTQGEGYLCQICRDHPRFRSFWPGRTEAGLGACCEEAARLILSQRAPLALTSVDGTLAEDVSSAPAAGLTDAEACELYALRERLFAAVYDGSRPLDEVESELLRLAGAVLPSWTAEGCASFYLGLERLDEAWTEVLQCVLARGAAAELSSFDRYMAARQQEYRNMLAYFLYRHVPEALEDGDPATKAAFAVLSCRFLRLAGAVWYEERGSFSFCDQTELFRMYAAEIEYSEDNMDALYDALWEASACAPEE